MLKTFGAALLLASGLAITAVPACALQIVVTQVDKNADGSAAGTPGAEALVSKQALIGSLVTPSFLADLK